MEAYSYLIQRNLNDGGVWVPFLEDSLRQELLGDVSKCISWFEDDDTIPLLELQEKLAHFKKLGEPVLKRARFYD